MSPPPVRLSARQRQELEKQDFLLLAQPLRADARVLAAYTRHMVRLLRNRRSASPSTDAVLFITQAFERSVAAQTPADAKAALACRAGCAYCCAQPVAVTPMEVFALVALTRARDGGAAAVAAAAEKLKGRDLEKISVRCPLLLEGNACSVYALRPLSCHVYVSLDVRDCIKTFVLQDKPSVRSPAAYNAMMDICRYVLVAALKLCGMPSHIYELSAALTLALTAEDAESVWWQGENIFAGLTPVAMNANLDAEITRFAQKVGV